MGIKFKLSASDLNRALDVVKVVQPKPLTPQGEQGYLFVVRGPRCYIYSRDTTRVARADFPIEEVEGEGAFVYPDKVAGLRMLQGPMSIETESNAEGNPIVRYRCEGSVSEKIGFDPRLMSPFDKEYDAATDERTLPAPVLRVAVAEAKKYLLQPDDTKAEENFKTMQIFDDSKEEWSKGNGNLYASDSTQMLYFWCDAFKGKGLAIHSNHISNLTSFLAKTNGDVTFRTGPNMTFVTDVEGGILGWAHHTKTHAKYKYYALSGDKFVLKVNQAQILRSLKHLRSELDPTYNKVKLMWSDADKRLTFQINDGKNKVEGIPVPVNTVVESTGEDLSCFANVDHLISLFEGVSANEAEFRLCPVAPSPSRPKGTVVMRTIDNFWLNAEGKLEFGDKDNPPADSYECRVTRFVPAKD